MREDSHLLRKHRARHKRADGTWERSKHHHQPLLLEITPFPPRLLWPKAPLSLPPSLPRLGGVMMVGRREGGGMRHHSLIPPKKRPPLRVPPFLKPNANPATADAAPPARHGYHACQ